MKEEMILFQNVGWGETAIVLFGVIQLVGGLILLPFKIRKSGALIMMLTYITATIVVFMNQMWVFGIVSILFILMAYWVYKRPIQLLNEKI